MLKHIETRCFNIPTTHLYDLIVGTSIGGQIALALTAASPSTPISVGAATRKFKQMMRSSFIPKRAIFSSINMVLNKTKYQAMAVERQLKDFFSESAKLNDTGSSQSRSPPNVAVTTVFQEGLIPHIIANYNRSTTEKSAPLLLPSNAGESMTIWAAARCTSAVLPYFKAFQWEGQTLLDGGFHWNCPVVVASEEAELIWPNKRRDLLLSLGTGMSSDAEAPTTNNILQVFKHVVEVVTSAEKLWKKFADSQVGDHLGQQGLFRLNPSWGDAEFVLDDYKRLDELERTTTGWLATIEPEVTPICDWLMAALFFFVSAPPIQNGALTGYIICRLPADESYRQSLVEGMLQERDSNLFAVEFVNKNRDLVFINVERDLRDLRKGGELRIPVILKELPYIGKIEVQITMHGITGSTKVSSELWYPISGSPYVLREERLGAEQSRWFS
ncbi:acyl transferase/acyl hydrolase/lysophospholipase [Collybia nuda]|uniref:Acyl transferase/acyl hydrolase/lysophospholipase n=1 Tax=Collybia nuda TaxID=64659 RepID=A0A9P5XUC7_9AGAR|nr:acyl transferase/acyl hydrolase/lysophospholipase [Collybia nuda]